jgi:hypothetical protein
VRRPTRHPQICLIGPSDHIDRAGRTALRPATLARLAGERRETAQRDAGQNGRASEHLDRPGRVAEQDDAGDRADQRLKVDEGAGHLGVYPGLPVREERVRHKRGACGQRDHGEREPGTARRPRQVLGCHGDRQRGQRCAEELHGCDGDRIAALQQPGLRHGERGRQRQRGQHQAVAADARPAAVAARDESHSGQRDRESGPGDRAGHGPVPERGDDRDDHRFGTDQQSRVADAGPADAGVLQQDSAAVADRPGNQHAGSACGPEPGASGDEQDRGGQTEAHECEPCRGQPLKRQLGQRHARAPEQSGGGECGEGGLTAAVHSVMVTDGRSEFAARGLLRDIVS